MFHQTMITTYTYIQFWAKIFVNQNNYNVYLYKQSKITITNLIETLSYTSSIFTKCSLLQD